MSTSQLERLERPLTTLRTRSSQQLRQLVAHGEGVRAFIDRHRPPTPPIELYVPGVTRLSKILRGPALLGFFASLSILAGASQSSSPFTLKNPGSWFFGLPSQPKILSVTPKPGQWLFLGVVAVYGGMLLLLRAWYDLVRITSRYRPIPVARLVPVFIAWVLPLLVVAPLFSRDVYSYAAQGEMMTHGINPYDFGPAVLGSASPFNLLVDPLWRVVPSPYGPAFLLLAGGVVSVAGHSVLLSVLGVRLVALAGTIAFSVGVVRIARNLRRDAAAAFVLAGLNPLVLLHLIAGAHNDALMLGLLVLGYSFAREGRPIIGVVMVGFAAAVKVPALLGALYIGWEWLGPARPWRQRLRPAATVLALAVFVMAALSEAAGLGWGWIGGLSNPDAVRSWLDPATGIGLAAGRIVSMIGLGYHTHVLLTIARGTGLLLAAALSVTFLVRSEEIGPLRALSWSLVAIVVLSPVIQPWYAAWGFVFLAPIAEGRVRQLLVVISGVACFLGLPGGRVLIDELGIANPLLVGLASLALVFTASVLVYPRIKTFIRPVPQRELAEL